MTATEEWVPQGDQIPSEFLNRSWVEWGEDLHPRTISARRKGDLWVVEKMGVYFDTDTMIGKIAHVIDYHGERLTSIRVDVGLTDMPY